MFTDTINGTQHKAIVVALDDRIKAVINDAPTADQSRALFSLLLRAVAHKDTAKRQAVWDHLSKHARSVIKDRVAELSRIYETVAAELEKKPQGKGQQRLAEMKARLAAMPASMEGD